MKKAAFLPFAALTLCLCMALLTVTAFGEKADVTIEQMLEAARVLPLLEVMEHCIA